MKLKMQYAILIIGVLCIATIGTYWMLNQSGEDEDIHGGNWESIREKIYSLPYQNLSSEEIMGLQYMREEEKLAHDVYNYAYSKYGTKIFSNIADSENTHTFMVSVLLEKYNLTDPAKDEPAGSFKNKTLQELYESLISRVNGSEQNALIAGGNIEELDIIDIKEWINKADNEDIKYVYNFLINGSKNHLRAFVSTLQKKYDYTYKPEYLTEEEYNKIIGEW